MKLYPIMRPELFTIAGIHFYAYRTMLAIAFIAGTLLAVRLARARGDAANLTSLAGIWALAGALIGARAFYVIQYEKADRLLHALFIWEGGLVFYGGLAGGIAAVLIYLRMHAIAVLPAFDAMAPSLALGEAITRVGCFLNGCCYGRACSLPWGVQFPPESVAYSDLLDAGTVAIGTPYTPALHPTELYMTVWLLGVFAVLYWLFYRKPRSGTVFYSYLALYGLARFAMEAFRGDSAYSVAGLTVSQAISVVLFAVGTVLLLVTRRATRGRNQT